MEDELTNEFIAENLELLFEQFDYFDSDDISELSEFLITAWVLLDVIEDDFFDENDNLLKDNKLYEINEEIYNCVSENDKRGFVALVKNHLISSEKYEILALMRSI